MLRLNKKNKCPLFVVSFLTIALLMFSFCSRVSQASVATDSIKSNFEAGYILGDSVMKDKNSMSENDIQLFLKSKNSCNNTNYADYQKYTARGYNYDWKDGHFVCMADENFDGKSAAHIIWQASQDYNINPKVFIVLLQKEQGLITDTWPNSTQYSSATGYSCPDDGSCDSSKSGFENQIRGAGSLFNEVMNGGWSNYPVGINYIQYSPTASCGGSSINIVNKATSALYRYTPYQPDDSALSAGYGNGDSCSAYGNRNFWLYFVDWFGSTKDASGISLSNGTYRISSTQGKSLDVPNDNYLSGTKLHIWDQNNTGAQHWQLTSTGDGYYTIMNQDSGKYLDVPGGSTVAGTPIQIWDGNNTDSQKWAIIKNNDGYRFVSKVGDKSLDISGGAVSTSGAQVQIWDSNNSEAQQWSIENVTTVSNISILDNTYRISSTQGKSLDVPGDSNLSGTKLHIWDQNGTGAQRWRLTSTGDGYYTIMNQDSGKYLEATNNSLTQISDMDNTDSQKWAIIKNNDGYRFVSKVANKSLDISGGAVSTSGAQVQIWDSNSTIAQKWLIDKASITSDISLLNGTYRISSTQGKSLDVPGDSNLSGTKLHIWDQNGTGAQRWRLTSTGDGYYTIMNQDSGKYLDVPGGSAENGVLIQIWDGNNTDSQKWAIIKNNDGYRFVSKVANKSLDISGGAVSISGAAIQTLDDNNSDAQKWLIDKI